MCTSRFLYSVEYSIPGMTSGTRRTVSSVIDCLEFGSASAAMLVASHACSQDMPSVEAVKEFIKKEKEEYGEMIARA